jgi:large subunit ribosomal protein L13
MDCGDHVIVINAEKINVTGRKLANNKFFWHTGYVGGIKERTWGKILSGKRPEQLLHNAVKRMMPKESPLARQQLEKNLLIYSGSQHPHQAQKPQPLPL